MFLFIFFIGIPIVTFAVVFLTAWAVSERFKREHGRKPRLIKSSLPERLHTFIMVLIPLLNLVLLFTALFALDAAYEKICEKDRELGGTDGTV